VELTDTHCHLDLENFDSDRSEVLERAWMAGLTRILIPGIDLASSKRVISLAGSDSRLFAGMGVHPNDALSWDENTRDELRRLFQNPYDVSVRVPGEQRIVAIGEIGLDYYWNAAPHEQQWMVLNQQLTLAAELKLPVVLHLREKEDAMDGECARDMLQILRKWTQALTLSNNPLAMAPGVLHSFSGSQHMAKEALELNFYIGVTGPVTFKNAEAKREVVKSLPLERLLIETDAPFLAPVPKRGRRNEPAFVSHITDKIAEIHNKNPDEIAALTSANASRLFSWGG
jgi:TatD DNase family protein